MISEYFWRAFQLFFQTFFYFGPFPFSWDPFQKRLHRHENTRKVLYSKAIVLFCALLHSTWLIHFSRIWFNPCKDDSDGSEDFMLTTMALAQTAVISAILLFALFYTFHMSEILVMYNDTIIKFQQLTKLVLHRHPKLRPSPTEDFLAFGTIFIVICAVFTGPGIANVITLTNLDPLYALILSMTCDRQFTKSLLILPIRGFFAYVYYVCAMRWVTFCFLQLLIVLMMGVKFLERIWYLQRNVPDSKMPSRNIHRLWNHFTEVMIFHHRMVSLTCNNWSYVIGTLVALLLAGGAFFWGYIDFFLVKYYESTPLSSYLVYVALSLIVKMFFTLLIALTQQFMQLRLKLQEK